MYHLKCQDTTSLEQDWGDVKRRGRAGRMPLNTQLPITSNHSDLQRPAQGHSSLTSLWERRSWRSWSWAQRCRPQGRGRFLWQSAAASSAALGGRSAPRPRSTWWGEGQQGVAGGNSRHLSVTETVTLVNWWPEWRPNWRLLCNPESGRHWYSAHRFSVFYFVFMDFCFPVQQLDRCQPGRPQIPAVAAFPSPGKRPRVWRKPTGIWTRLGAETTDCLSAYLSDCLSHCGIKKGLLLLSEWLIECLSGWLTICLSLTPVFPTLCLSICLTDCLSMRMSHSYLGPSVCLTLCLSLTVSASQSAS